MKSIPLIALLAAALPALATAEDAVAARPITHEDVFLVQRPGTPQPSPDGRWVVFALPQPSYDHEKRSSDLWLVPADGSAPPRALTSTRDPEGAVAWSPDSSRLAFTAKREGDDERQVYVLDLAAGGEARRVTTLAAGANAPLWSPDGRALLVVTLAHPDAADEEANRKAIDARKARKFNTRTYEEFPIRHWDRWLDERRPMPVVVPVEGDARPRYLLAGTRLFAGRGYGGVLGNEGESLPAAWTPDGTGVVFVAIDNRHEAARREVTTGLWLVPASGGEPQRLTDATASWSDPRFSPDGRHLYAKVTPVTRYVYNGTRLARFEWGREQGPEVLTAGFDRSVEDYGIAPDGSRAWFLAEDEGLVRLFEVSPGSTARELGRLEAGSYSALRVGGSGVPLVTAVWESAVNPPEVVRIDADGRRHALSAFNVERAAGIDWQPVEHFWFTSSRGKRIHSVLIRPPGFDPSKKYPLFVLIHGGPHTMMGDQFVTRWNYHLLARPGYVVLAPNYSGSTGFGERFAQSIQGDPLAGPASELNEAADAAIRRYPFIDGSRQAAGGASYGGHLANWLAVSTTRYRALVSHAGLFDLRSQWTTSDVAFSREKNLGGPAWENRPVWREQSPFYRARELRTPILVTFGERDFRVPINNALEFWTVLKRQDVPSRLVVFPDENHWILRGENSREFYREVHDWLARFLEPAE